MKTISFLLFWEERVLLDMSIAQTIDRKISRQIGG